MKISTPLNPDFIHLVPKRIFACGGLKFRFSPPWLKEKDPLPPSFSSITLDKKKDSLNSSFFLKRFPPAADQNSGLPPLAFGLHIVHAKVSKNLIISVIYFW